MSQSASGPVTSRRPRLFGHRHRFLVDPRAQLRPALLTMGVVAALLAVLNALLYVSSVASTNRMLLEAPELAPLLHRDDRLQLYLMIAASAVTLIGVFLVAVLETHRTAGAAFNLSRCLGRVARGDLSVRAALRKGDNLRQLGEAFNRMAVGLEQGALGEIDALERLSEEARAMGGAACDRIADELGRLARRKRESLGER